MAEAISIGVSVRAADRIRRALAERGSGLGVRIGVKSSGCSGFSYVLEYADEVVDGDWLVEKEGVKLLVEGRSAAMLDGTVLDYVREGFNEGFRFENPNVKSSCGCGESFTV